MRVWQIAREWSIEGMALVERPDPMPGPGQVAARMRAASLNYRDLLTVQGKGGAKLPLIPCSDGAGEIVSVGEGVTSWKPGDRVAGIFMQNWIDGPPTPAKTKGALGGDIDGMLADFVILHET